MHQVIAVVMQLNQGRAERILNKYLKEFIGKLNTRKEHLQHIQVSGSPAESECRIEERSYFVRSSSINIRYTVGGAQNVLILYF